MPFPRCWISIWEEGEAERVIGHKSDSLNSPGRYRQINKQPNNHNKKGSYRQGSAKFSQSSKRQR
jgi:hypothetical protein